MTKNFGWKQLALPLLLIAAVSINKTTIQPPNARPTDTGPASFSAKRAMEHVRMIAIEPHAVGTPANKRVRDALVAHLTAAGLEVEVQSTQILDGYRSYGNAHQTGSAGHRHRAAYVNNIIARLRGRTNSNGEKGTGQAGKALALMSHYDSVYYGPGASDDASGTATLLETLRALQAGAPLENDLILLITDAEEVGLLGAQAFFSKHRWAKDIGLVLNFEARGSKGPVSMFQTSALNDQLIGVFADTVKSPFANSLTVTIYREMPNDTDLSISLKAGVAGMNFAFIDGFYDYHTEGDNPDNLSPQTLQHMGDQALAMTRAMGNKQLPLADSEELVFFDFLSLFLISYPLWVSHLLMLAAVVVFVPHFKKQAADGGITLKGLTKSVFGALLLIAAFGLIVDVLFLMIGGRSGDMVEGRRLFALADEQLLAFTLIGFALALAWFRMLAKGFHKYWAIGGALLAALLFIYEPTWIPAAVTAVLTTASFITLRKPISIDERLYGALALYLLVALIVHFLAPAGSYLFVWPFLFVATGLYLQSAGKAGIATISLLSLLGALWLTFFTEQGYSALGVAFPGVIAVPFGLLLIMLVPLFMRAVDSDHKSLGAVSGSFGIALIAYTAIATGFTERHNQPTEVFYVLNVKGDGVNHFGSRLARQDDWSSQLIKGQIETVQMEEIIPSRKGSVSLAVAPQSIAKALSVSNSSHTGNVASVTLKPGYRGDFILLSLSSSAPMTAISIGGEALEKPEKAPTAITLQYFAVPHEGLLLDIETVGEVSLHAAEITNQWPADVAGSIPRKPAYIMRAPYRFSDNTISSMKHTISAPE